MTASKKRIADWQQVTMPSYISESELSSSQLGSAQPESGWTRMAGLCVSVGCVEAKVTVLRDPREFSRMKRGSILVAPATDPSWTPLFTLASGVIVEMGGTLSHASTVAREYRLPALANVRGATRALRDGDRVRLDATNGVVELIGPVERSGSKDATEGRTGGRSPADAGLGWEAGLLMPWTTARLDVREGV